MPDYIRKPLTDNIGLAYMMWQADETIITQ